jgi:2-polyprenyl-3-methyl-5-hydroxy-6-metoxy-1,4-benzoquinol methylase
MGATVGKSLNPRRMVEHVFDSYPKEWTLKEGNLCFNQYVSYVSTIIREARFIKHEQPLTFLDIGLSMGVVACAASMLGYKVSGVDNQKNTEHKILSSIRRQYQVAYANYDATVDKLPFADEIFDLVNCNDMIEHLHTSPQLMLQEAKRVLRRGGAVIITTPNLAGFHNRLLLLFGGSVHHSITDWFHSPAWKRPTFTGHIREYTPREMRYMLKESGFNEISVATRNILPASIRTAKPEPSEVFDFSGLFGYLKDVPFYDRKFSMTSFRDFALFSLFLATYCLPNLGMEIVATARK